MEHQSALSLALRAARTAQHAAEADLPELSAEIERRWARELLPHFSREESALLPVLERAGLRELAQRTRNEHRALEALVCDTDLPPREKIARFADLLAAHVRFEERQLFEAAQSALSDAQLGELLV